MRKLENDEEKLFKNNQQCLEEVYIESGSIFKEGKDSKVRVHFACIADKL